MCAAYLAAARRSAHRNSLPFEESLGVDVSVGEAVDPGGWLETLPKLLGKLGGVSPYLPNETATSALLERQASGPGPSFPRR